MNPSKTIFLLLILFFHVLFISAQNPVVIQQGDLKFKGIAGAPMRTMVLTADLSPLKAGDYKAIDGNRYSLFQVNDSGYLTGSMKVFSEKELEKERLWEKGVQYRELIYSKGKLFQELFDTTASVFVYDSLRNEWAAVIKPVSAIKEYPQSEGGRLSITLSGSKTHYGQYAKFYYSSGKLSYKIFPDNFEEMYDTAGNVTFQRLLNWKLKQIEVYNFKNGISYKNIIRDKNTCWNKDGMFEYIFNENAGEDQAVEYYIADKLTKREVTKNYKKTITEFNASGKIISRNTYNIPKAELPGQIVSPSN